MKTVCLTLIALYRYGISPLLGPACRFEPTCSDYAGQAIHRFGVLHGCRLAIWRVLKCQPFHTGGYDPVVGKTAVHRKS
jgi:uncharacterized protein